MFTVIVPTHNRPLLLQRTLRSLIEQTYREFQVIVVDDAATFIPPFTELAELKGRYTYVIRSGESGPAQSRNLASALVNTPYAMFLDDDDTLAPDHLKAWAEHIGTTTAPLHFCDFSVCYEDRTASPPTPLSSEVISLSDVTKDSVFVRNRIPNSCVVYRRDVLQATQHDTSLEIYEDWDFLLQCLGQHPVQHAAHHSVRIHKSAAGAAENLRRGNTRDDLIAKVMLELYKRHPAPSTIADSQRKHLMQSVGITL
jgi:glycosyltransferase involved in cell wall biosynthesis